MSACSPEETSTNQLYSFVWKWAGLFKPCELKAQEHGWLLTNDRYAINWLDCVQLPQDIVNILSDNVQESNDEI